MIITRYTVEAENTLKAAVVADLHGQPTEKLSAALISEQPDVILIPGDLCTVGEYKDRPIDPDKRRKRNEGQERAIRFLKEAGKIAPVFYSRGNHEWELDNAFRKKVQATGAVLLENEWVAFNRLFIGGQNSAKRYDDEALREETRLPDTDWLKETPEGYKILLCHHPEYFPLIHNTADLILSGHAHGGQWRFFDKGVFAPDQGLFPQYTKGRYGNMIVSAGLTNTTWIPRLFNPTELVIIEWMSDMAQQKNNIVIDNEWG